MKHALKDKSATIFVSIATILLAGIAVFTAVRMYQLRQESLSPAAPESAPLATGDRSRTTPEPSRPQGDDRERDREMTNYCHAIQATCESWGIHLAHPAIPFSAQVEYKSGSEDWILAGEGSSQGADEPKTYLFGWTIQQPPAGSQVRINLDYNNGIRTLSAGIMPDCDLPTPTLPLSITPTPTMPLTLSCEYLAFSLSTPTPTQPTGTPSNTPTATLTPPTSTPTNGPTSTPTNGPSSTPTNKPSSTPTTPVGGPSSTITPTTPLQCNQTCTTNASCGGGLTCYKSNPSDNTGVCRNASCTSESDCSCNVATTTSPSNPELPPAGVGLPTIIAGILGTILVTIALAFAL